MAAVGCGCLPRKPAHLAASTVHRWLDAAGQVAQASVPGQLQGIAQSEELGTDGLWARLRGGATRVVLLLADSVTGLLWPPVVAEREDQAAPWQRLFARARQAGLDWEGLRGVTSDGAQGRERLSGPDLGLGAAPTLRLSHLAQLGGPAGPRSRPGRGHRHRVTVAEAVREQVRSRIGGLDPWGDRCPQLRTGRGGAGGLVRSHPQGAVIGQFLNAHLDRILVHLVAYYAGLQRVTPEWYWRDFRLRLSRGRNHGSDPRLERAALVWAIYHNFEPAQWRSERKRHSRYPGQSPLQVAGAPPGQVSYLDALGV